MQGHGKERRNNRESNNYVYKNRQHWALPVVVVDVFCCHVIRVFDAHVRRIGCNRHGGESGRRDPIGAYFERFIRAYAWARVPSWRKRDGVWGERNKDEGIATTDRNFSRYVLT